jgi:hypothetical protein
MICCPNPMSRSGAKKPTMPTTRTPTPINNASDFMANMMALFGPADERIETSTTQEI